MSLKVICDRKNIKNRQERLDMCRGGLEEERRKRGKPLRRLMVVLKRVNVTGRMLG